MLGTVPDKTAVEHLRISLFLFLVVYGGHEFTAIVLCFPFLSSTRILIWQGLLSIGSGVWFRDFLWSCLCIFSPSLLGAQQGVYGGQCFPGGVGRGKSRRGYIYETRIRRI